MKGDLNINEERFNDLINIINVNRDDDDLGLALRNFLRNVSLPIFEDIWIDAVDDFCPISYWLYLSNDISDEREMEAIKHLLYWKEFNGKSISKVKCLQISDSFFYNLCVKKFKPNLFPCLIVSDTKYFVDFIEINSEILFRVDSNKILGFLNSIHREISVGSPLTQVRDFVKSNLSHFQIDFEKIINLVADGNLFDAIRFSESSLNLSQAGLKTIVLLKSQIADIEKQRIGGVMSNEDYTKHKNQIVDRFVDFIQQIKNRKIRDPRTAADIG